MQTSWNGRISVLAYHFPRQPVSRFLSSQIGNQLQTPHRLGGGATQATGPNKRELYIPLIRMLKSEVSLVLISERVVTPLFPSLIPSSFSPCISFFRGTTFIIMPNLTQTLGAPPPQLFLLHKVLLHTKKSPEKEVIKSETSIKHLLNYTIHTVFFFLSF